MSESYYTRGVPLERELKLSSPEGYVPSRAELDHALGGLLIGGAQVEVETGSILRHQDTYFDTPVGTLATHGLTLRQRARNAGSTVTLKADALPDGAGDEPAAGLFERIELDVLHDGPVPPWPSEIAAALAARLPAGALSAVRPTVVLEVVRITHRLVGAATTVGRRTRLDEPATSARASVAPDGVLLVELSFDEVTCRQPPSHAADPHGQASEVRFHEVELEAGPDVGVRSLETVAEALATLLPLTPSNVSKAERARALLAAFM